jgi:hypothetical protein
MSGHLAARLSRRINAGTAIFMILEYLGSPAVTTLQDHEPVGRSPAQTISTRRRSALISAALIR